MQGTMKASRTPSRLATSKGRTDTYADCRSRVAAHVGEKITQQGQAPMHIGGVECGSDQLEEVRNVRRLQRERETNSHRRKPHISANPTTPRTARRARRRRNGNRGEQRHSARLCPSQPMPRRDTMTKCCQMKVTSVGSTGSAHSAMLTTKMTTSWRLTRVLRNTACGNVSQLWLTWSSGICSASQNWHPCEAQRNADVRRRHRLPQMGKGGSRFA